MGANPEAGAGAVVGAEATVAEVGAANLEAVAVAAWAFHPPSVAAGAAGAVGHTDTCVDPAE